MMDSTSTFAATPRSKNTANATPSPYNTTKSYIGCFGGCDDKENVDPRSSISTQTKSRVGEFPRSAASSSFRSNGSESPRKVIRRNQHSREKIKGAAANLFGTFKKSSVDCSETAPAKIPSISASYASHSRRKINFSDMCVESREKLNAAGTHISVQDNLDHFPRTRVDLSPSKLDMSELSLSDLITTPYMTIDASEDSMYAEIGAIMKQDSMQEAEENATVHTSVQKTERSRPCDPFAKYYGNNTSMSEIDEEDFFPNTSKRESVDFVSINWGTEDPFPANVSKIDDVSFGSPPYKKVPIKPTPMHKNEMDTSILCQAPLSPRNHVSSSNSSAFDVVGSKEHSSSASSAHNEVSPV